MKWLIGIVSLALFWGCCPTKLLNSSTTDNVRVEVVEKIVKDTVTVTLEIPIISEKIVTRDTISHLENKYSLSDALIDSNGYLHHSLSTKSIKEAKNVQIEYVTRDSIVTQIKEVVNVVEVERQLTKWQNTRLQGFWILLSIILVFLGIKIRKLLI